MMMVRGFFLFCIVCLALVGCRENELPFEITAQDDGRTLVAIGVIDGSTPLVIEEALSTYPQAQTLILQFVPGSINEEQNKVASRMIRDHGLKTVVPADGLVASGGTAMFVSGATRVLEKGACVGVHTWWQSNGAMTGAGLAPDDNEHLEYLEYYRDMGITPEFYWFGIRAANEEDFHWLGRSEISLFELETAAEPYTPTLKNKPVFCDRRLDEGFEARMDARFGRDKAKQEESRKAALDRLAEIRARRAEREEAQQETGEVAP